MRYYSTDNVGNNESIQEQIVKIDKTAPTTSISPDGQSCSRTQPTVTLSCSDSGSGCDKTYYNVVDASSACGGTMYEYTGPFQILCDGYCQKKVCFYSTDSAGNAEVVKQSNVFYIDRAPPTSVDFSVPNRTAMPNGTFSWSSTDVGCAGLDKYEFQVATDENFENVVCNFSTSSPSATCSLENQKFYFVRARSNDTLGNVNNWTNISIYEDRPITDHIITIGMSLDDVTIPYKSYKWLMRAGELYHYYVCSNSNIVSGMIFSGSIFNFLKNGTEYRLSEYYNGNDFIIPFFEGSCNDISNHISDIERGTFSTSFTKLVEGSGEIIYMILKFPYDIEGYVHISRGNHKLVIERTSNGLRLSSQ